MLTLQIIFWTSLLFIAYTYLGYPLLLYIFSRIRFIPVIRKKMENLPKISIIIAAKNEGELIYQRLKNLLAQDYPQDKVEIIVISDGSEDDTVELVLKIRSEHSQENAIIKFLELDLGQGKPSALNRGVALATGDFLVFADCRQSFAKDTVRRLIENFSDKKVGCVSGELLFRESLESDIEKEMGFYWKFEKIIRKLECKTGSVVGVTGAVYAMRRSLFRTIPKETLLDDLYCPLQCYYQGYRVLFDARAKAYDTVSDNVQKEWQRKVRTLAGNWQLFSLFGAALIPVRFRLWWKFYSHKIARLVVPFLLPIVLLCSGLIDGELYQLLFWLQIVSYSVVLAGVVFPFLKKNRIVGLCYFFMVLNFAAVVGWYRWLKGDFTKGWK